MELINGTLHTVRDLCFCADMPLAWEHLTCYEKYPHWITSRNSDHDGTRYVNNLEMGTQGINHGSTCVFCEASVHANVLIYFWTTFYSPITSIIFEAEQSFERKQCLNVAWWVAKCQTLPLNVNRSRVTNDCAVVGSGASEECIMGMYLLQSCDKIIEEELPLPLRLSYFARA